MRGRVGFTLIEIVLVIVVAAVAIPSIMLLFSESVRGSAEVHQLGTASRLAQDLMEEIRTRRWDENSPDGGGWTSSPSATLGVVDAGETTRVRYDDVDDYAAIIGQSPPRDALDQVMSEYPGYARSVVVEYVDDAFLPPTDPTVLTDHKRITVTVSFAGGEVSVVTVRSNY